MSDTVLSRARTTWIDTIVLDSDDHDATVTLNIPTDPTANHASYEETIDFDDPATPQYLHDAARAFTEAAVQFIRERAATKLPEGLESSCVSCTGACCARIYTEVGITSEDIERMGGAESVTVRRGVVLHPYGQSWNGYLGMLRRTSWQGEGDAMAESDERKMACVFLDTKTSLCTIYDARPDICREYTAHDCASHEAGSQQLLRLRRKHMKGA